MKENTMNRIPLVLASLVLGACVPLETPRSVMGNFEATFADNMRVYIDDTLVAEVTPGTDASFEWNGETFQVSTLCSDEGVECPSETFSHTVAVDQPWGSEYKLLNFVNLDPEHGDPGDRMGGLLEADGTFNMLAGLQLGANGNCAAVGLGVVTGAFNADNTAIEGGKVVYGWAAGCAIGDQGIGASLRLETDFTAVRTGDYDVSSVTPADPIDETGEVVDPADPEAGYEVGTEETGAGDTGVEG